MGSQKETTTHCEAGGLTEKEPKVTKQASREPAGQLHSRNRNWEITTFLLGDPKKHFAPLWASFPPL
jgi:hypothetical protein